MCFLNSALELAGMGFHVFPLVTNSKKPLIKDFPNRATRDPQQIKNWWLDDSSGLVRPFNIGISTTKFADDEALIVIDVDNKGEKKGDEEVERLKSLGKVFPKTFTQITPTKGRHLFLRNKIPLKQGVNVLGKGLDVRSSGGYVVGAGSEIDGVKYEIIDPSPVEYVSDWTANELGLPRIKNESKIDLSIINKDAAIKRAIRYLKNYAPPSVKGDGGDQTAYKVAAHVKDQGVDPDTCLQLMMEHWYEGSGWSAERLKEKIDHAYRYGINPPGIKAPEVQFAETKSEVEISYLEKMNQEYALIMMGGKHYIMKEVYDNKKKYLTQEYWAEPSFKKWFSTEKIQTGKTIAQEWLDWKGRRQYLGIDFAPCIEPKKGYYNLWTDFTCKPVPYEEASTDAKLGFDAFILHAKENVSGGDEFLFNWLMAYFAHTVQRPWEKPLTAVVFKGSKGVGKNALLERFGNLFGKHFAVAHDKKYLTGRFNSHIDSCLVLGLDEAFWSGDKDAEGILKGMITSPEIFVEKKNIDAYKVRNLVRIFIIGNEEWIVPASNDERRFSVYEVGDGKKQNNKFFEDMRVRIDEKGGDSVLLHYFQNFDLSKIDINTATKTTALLDQKLNSLDPFSRWWYECLVEGRITHSDFGDQWPIDISKERFRSAFKRYCKERQIRGWVPDQYAIGRIFKKVLPSIIVNQKKRTGSELFAIYRIPDLETSRKEFENHMGQKIDWSKYE